MLGKHLMNANLMCNFNLGNVFLFKNGSQFHVEVADFDSDEVSIMWSSLTLLLRAIFEMDSNYHFKDDLEMIEVLVCLESNDIE